MTDARDDILSRVRAGLGAALLPDAPTDHPTSDLPRSGGGVDQFIAEVERVSGRVVRVKSSDEAVQVVVDLCQERNWNEGLAWTWDQIGLDGLVEALAGAGIKVLHAGRPGDLAHIPVGLTGAEAGLADTGTLVLRNGAARSPLASLLPPVHVALLDSRRIYPDMAAYFDSLPDSATYIREASNLVFITGPSRTADIEQTLTLGVHGPREVIVILM